jgi:hypothetical protein
VQSHCKRTTIVVTLESLHSEIEGKEGGPNCTKLVGIHILYNAPFQVLFVYGLVAYRALSPLLLSLHTLNSSFKLRVCACTLKVAYQCKIV